MAVWNKSNDPIYRYKHCHPALYVLVFNASLFSSELSSLIYVSFLTLKKIREWDNTSSPEWSVSNWIFITHNQNRDFTCLTRLYSISKLKLLHLSNAHGIPNKVNRKFIMGRHFLKVYFVSTWLQSVFNLIITETEKQINRMKIECSQGCLNNVKSFLTPYLLITG